MNLVPKRPLLWAAGVYTVWVAILCWPMLLGDYLVGPFSDQYGVGYGFREFGAAYFREHHAIAQWNPYIFGGLPFVAAMHGDIFYPSAWVRYLVSTDTALNVAFASHLVLAGLFTYLFLRALKLPWLAAVVGGLAYQLAGPVASLVHPGHDGKLFVSALFPLGLYALTRAVRDRWIPGYGMWALVVGLALISPHFQLAYYMLIAAGLFTLYLVFFDTDGPRGARWWLPLGGALAGVGLGLGVAAVQILPFVEYIPFSPRSLAGSQFSGWEYATSWSLPPEELISAVVPQFNGVLDAYWGRNAFKLHTEHLGVTVLILATAGWLNRARRRLLWATAVIAGFMLIVSLGGYTPLYRLFYAVFPGMKLVRAPSMAFYLVAFVVAIWAALGVERWLAKPPALTRTAVLWAGALAAASLLAVTGLWTAFGEAIAEDQKIFLVAANQTGLVLGTLRATGFAAGLAGLAFAVSASRVRGPVAATLLIGLVGADLWSVDRRFFVFSPPAKELYATDAVLERLAATPKPYRVLDLYPVVGQRSYKDGVLMGYGIPEVLGHHGNEVSFYDELLGGKNLWRFVWHPQTAERIRRELGVNYLISSREEQLPGWERVEGPVSTAFGGQAYLFRRDDPVPYARVIPAAIKVPDDQILGTFYNPAFPPDRLLLLPPSAPVEPPEVREIPAPSASRATVTAWSPGRIIVSLDPAPTAASYLRVSETFYPNWKALVDGASTPVLRGNYALVAVPIPAGAREIVLSFESDEYHSGRALSAASILVVGALFGVSFVQRRRQHA